MPYSFQPFPTGLAQASILPNDALIRMIQLARVAVINASQKTIKLSNCTKQIDSNIELQRKSSASLLISTTSALALYS